MAAMSGSALVVRDNVRFAAQGASRPGRLSLVTSGSSRVNLPALAPIRDAA
jgi:hypothetical protein